MLEAAGYSTHVLCVRDSGSGKLYIVFRVTSKSHGKPIVINVPAVVKHGANDAEVMGLVWQHMPKDFAKLPPSIQEIKLLFGFAIILSAKYWFDHLP